MKAGIYLGKEQIEIRDANCKCKLDTCTVELS